MPSFTARKRTEKSATEPNGAAELDNAQIFASSLTAVEVRPSPAAKAGQEVGNGQSGRLGGRDVHAIILLVILYMLQGIPVGLAFGTMPFLLKTKLSYADIGTFALSTYPYSLKLAWSPVVDSCWVSYVTLPIIGTRLGLGRRKSWIVPVQLTVGAMLWLLGDNVDRLLLNEKPPVITITALFFTLILFAATQDIAVDGWALTLLSQNNLSYASTAQTIGLNIGYFMSFTVFLALNSVEFSNKYLRPTAGYLEYPALSLSAYLRFASIAFILVTIWLAFFKDENEDAANRERKESKESLEDNLGLKGAYEVMWKICKLKHVQIFLLIHLVAKIGFQANEAVTGLKLVEKGFSKEDLALTVLIDFPFQIVLGYLAARWSSGDKALTPWLWGYAARLSFAVISMGIVAGLSWTNADTTRPTESGIGFVWFIIIILSTVAGSFASTVQFVGISAFHTQIADPLIGGTYMTLLNTVSNLGGTWPRYFVLKAVDAFTLSECRIVGTSQDKAASALEALSINDPVQGAEAAKALLRQLTEESKPIPGDALSSASSYTLLHAGESCATNDAAKQACLLSGTGRCITTRDGYFITSTVCVVIGLVLLIVFIFPQSRKLEKMKLEDWRVTRLEQYEEINGKAKARKAE